MRTSVKAILLLLASAVVTAAGAPKPERVTDAEIDSATEKLTEYAVGFFGFEAKDEFIEKINDELKGLMRMHQLTEPSDRVPADGLFVLPAGSKTFREVHNKSWTAAQFSMEKLIEFLDPLVKDTVEKVDGVIFQDWLQNKFQYGNKYVVVLIDPNQKKKHLGYRSLGLVSEFKNEFDLVMVTSNVEKVKDVLRLEKFPAVMSLSLAADPNKEGAKGVSAMQYTGPSVSFGYMFYWLRQILGKGGKVKDDPNSGPKQTEEAVPEFSDEITVMSEHNAEGLLNLCKNSLCFLAFENYWLEDSSRFEKTVERLRKVQKGFNRLGLKVIMIDAGCQQELLQAVGLQMEFLPNAVLYNAEAKQYTQLMGKFEVNEILDFIRKAKAKIYKPTALEKELTTVRKDCDAEREKWEALRLKSSVKSQEDDELMREVMEEIKKKEQEKQFQKSGKKKRRSEEL